METLTAIPALLPAHIAMKEGARKRKFAALLSFDASISQDGARWWLVLNENHRVGAFYRDQVETLLREWFANGFVVTGAGEVR